MLLYVVVYCCRFLYLLYAAIYLYIYIYCHKLLYIAALCYIELYILQQTASFSEGWPCQDISSAGLRQGLAGERSGLFMVVHKIITKYKPPHVLLENVASLRKASLHKSSNFPQNKHCVSIAFIVFKFKNYCPVRCKIVSRQTWREHGRPS